MILLIGAKLSSLLVVSVLGVFGQIVTLPLVGAWNMALHGWCSVECVDGVCKEINANKQHSTNYTP